MKGSRQPLAIACLLVTTWAACPLVSGELPAYAPDEVMVIYTETAEPHEIATVELIHGLRLINEIRPIRMRHYATIPGTDIRALCKALALEATVEAAEPNYRKRTQAVSLPDDPYYQYQWYLKNTGQMVNGGYPKYGVDISWEEALGIHQPGNESIIVAVIDTGLALHHPEFLGSGSRSGNIYLNSQDSYGWEGRDDDNNGYVDDLHGWDFLDDDNDPSDLSGHGTEIASIIAARKGNGIGISGISPNAVILPLRVADEMTRFYTDAVIAAVEYAVDHGARIINMSYGGSDYSVAEFQILKWASEQNVVLVTAAGNNGSSNDLFPCYPGNYEVDSMITVAAIDTAGRLADFSNYGVNTVDLAAPGVDMLGAEIAIKVEFLEGFDPGSFHWSTGALEGNQSIYDKWKIANSDGNGYLTDSLSISGAWMDYRSNTHTYCSSPWIDLTGMEKPLLGFEVIYELQPHNGGPLTDRLHVEVTRNGLMWYELGGLFGDPEGGYYSAYMTFSLEDYIGDTVRIRFRFVTDGSWNFDGVYIDNFTICDVPLYDYAGTEYFFDSGTSFSAPVVSGIAAMILAERPELLPIDIFELILRGARANPDSSLFGKVASSGSADAYQSLRMAKDYSFAAARIYCDATSHSGDWSFHPALGWCNLPNEVFSYWVYHADLGWIWPTTDTGNYFYAYTGHFKWIWMQVYPHFYAYDRANWITIVNEHWFYDHASGTWIELS